MDTSGCEAIVPTPLSRDARRPVTNIHIRHFQPGAVTDETALEQFQKQWRSYQKLVDADALSHRAVGKILHDTLANVFAKPFTFVDVACGDAGQTSRALADTTVRHYLGIDLSEPALEHAAKNLAGASPAAPGPSWPPRSGSKSITT
jgi:hypothetical protein